MHAERYTGARSIGASPPPHVTISTSRAIRSAVGLNHQRCACCCRAVSSSNGAAPVKQQLRDWHDVDQPRFWQVCYITYLLVSMSATNTATGELSRNAGAAAAVTVLVAIQQGNSNSRTSDGAVCYPQGTEEQALSHGSLQQLPAPWKVGLHSHCWGPSVAQSLCSMLSCQCIHSYPFNLQSNVESATACSCKSPVLVCTMADFPS